MHSNFLKECFPYRAYSYTDNAKEKAFHSAYPDFIPRATIYTSPETSPIKHRPGRVTPEHNFPPPPYDFTFDDLAFSLRGKSVVQPIDTERIQRKRRKTTFGWDGNGKPKKAAYFQNHHDVGPEQTWPISHLVTCQPNYFTVNNHSDIAPSNAIMSFIPEVQLCMSSLPGGELGVCCRTEIPKDTVIGPYKGRRVRAEDMQISNGGNMTYVWEIYKRGKLDHYLDGSDENVSCWMRFIRSARHKEEQNLCAIQHGENIFYRTLVNIPVGAELLVWYEEKYDEYLGIPIALHNDHHKSSQPETKSPPHLAYQSLRHEPFTPAMLKAMEKTRLWIDERLGMNFEGDNDILGTRNRHLDSHDDSSFPSSDGETSCTTPDDTDPHLWKCNQCQQSFSQRSALVIHECPTQTKNPFNCGHCSLSFADPSALRNHVGTHTNDRLFKCGYCGRRFAGATTLTNHIRTHTGEKPFCCDKCGKYFSQASQLSRHQRITGDCI